MVSQRRLLPPRAVIEIDAVDSLANQVVRTGSSELREQCSPNSLMSPEIGDETLMLWLQERGWRALESAEQSKDVKRAAECLRGLSILQSIVRRSLYKVRFTANRSSYELLSPGSHEDIEVELKIQKTLKWLRKDETARTNLETRMATAAGWPTDSLLLYVPPRKVQAKGIETGALDCGEVVTLGTHSAVREDVALLGEAYKGLWRIILLAHPKYSTDEIGLSKAVDELIKGVWEGIDAGSAVKALQEACWFSYIPEKQRPAAEKYRSMIHPKKPAWRVFRTALEDTANGTISTDEHVLRTVLLSNLQERGASAEFVRNKYGDPDSLYKHVTALETQRTVVGREGDSTAADVTLAVLQDIADELMTSHQPKLF